MTRVSIILRYIGLKRIKLHMESSRVRTRNCFNELGETAQFPQLESPHVENSYELSCKTCLIVVFLIIKVLYVTTHQ